MQVKAELLKRKQFQKKIVSNQKPIDWVGNNKSVFSSIGASSHAKGKREKHDFYATDPIAIIELLKFEKFNKNIWECACGQGHLSIELEKAGYNVKSTDLINRGYGVAPVDFLKQNLKFNGDIITNPPYKFSEEFIIKALELVNNGNKVAMFMGIQFLESKGRKKLFETNPPKIVYVASGRINCAKNGDFEKYTSSARSYCWYVWEKGFKGKPVIKWFN